VAPVRVAVLLETLQGADGSVRGDRVGATAFGAYFFLPMSTFTRWLARFAPRGTMTSRMPLS